jgi:negative regulator of flagellin synthesis FlgM
MPIDKITGLPGPQVQQREGAQVQVARTEPTKKQDETGRPSTVDTVTLTDTASRLRGLENTLANLPVVDSQRVEDIQRALEAGTFEMDYGRTAEKFLHFERELGGE